MAYRHVGDGKSLTCICSHFLFALSKQTQLVVCIMHAEMSCMSCGSTDRIETIRRRIIRRVYIRT